MKSEIMKGKRGLVMGVANDQSIAWGMARTLHAHGAEWRLPIKAKHLANGSSR